MAKIIVLDHSLGFKFNLFEDRGLINLRDVSIPHQHAAFDDDGINVTGIGKMSQSFFDRFWF